MRNARIPQIMLDDVENTDENCPLIQRVAKDSGCAEKDVALFLADFEAMRQSTRSALRAPARTPTPSTRISGSSNRAERRALKKQKKKKGARGDKLCCAKDWSKVRCDAYIAEDTSRSTGSAPQLPVGSSGLGHVGIGVAHDVRHRRKRDQFHRIRQARRRRGTRRRRSRRARPSRRRLRLALPSCLATAGACRSARRAASVNMIIEARAARCCLWKGLLIDRWTGPCGARRLDVVRPVVL